VEKAVLKASSHETVYENSSSLASFRASVAKTTIMVLIKKFVRGISVSDLSGVINLSASKSVSNIAQKAGRAIRLHDGKNFASFYQIVDVSKSYRDSIFLHSSAILPYVYCESFTEVFVEDEMSVTRLKPDGLVEMNYDEFLDETVETAPVEPAFVEPAPAAPAVVVIEEEKITVKDAPVESAAVAIEEEMADASPVEPIAVAMEEENVVEPLVEAFLTTEEKSLLLEMMENLPVLQATPFLEPVDWEGLELDDYLEVCPKPMDLNQIKSKLEQEQVLLSTILSNFSLVVENARKYSPRPHPINSAATNMYKAWLGRLAKSVFKNADIPPIESAAKRPSRKVCLYILNLKISKPVKFEQEPIAVSTATKRKASPKSPQSARKRSVRRLSTAQITQLSASIAGLPQSALDEVVLILADHVPKQEEGGAEFELDLDSLSSQTLSELHQFVQGVTGSL
jgi:hypothetical protein